MRSGQGERVTGNRSMTHRDRFVAMLVVLLLLAGAKVAQQLFRFYASRDERVEIARLELRIGDAGAGIVATKVRADSLRAAVESMDNELRAGRDRLELTERRLLSGPATAAQENAYLEELGIHNDLVTGRNAVYREWRASVDSHGNFIRSYNAIVDSIRSLAVAIGEPYYPISSPAEIATERRNAVEQR